MIKIIEFNINEILLAEKACSDSIKKACLRTPVTPYHVTGISSNIDNVFVILEQYDSDIILPEYRFAPLSTLNGKDIGSEISSRYYAGFTTIGSFIVDDKVWALFALNKTKDNAEKNN
jgi:hypothetical protein